MQIKNSLFILFFFICGCGLPDTAIQSLNTPMGVTLTKSCNSGNNTFTIQFWGYNFESYFTGYNIYVYPNPADPVNTLPNVVKSHIKSDKSFDGTVENNYIIKNSFQSYPSITVDYLNQNFPTFSARPTFIQFQSSSPPIGMSTKYLDSTIYYFVVTAISYANRMETIASDIQFITCP